MPNYLTKEEMRQWRSSLERITLEDFAKRLGKVINDEKETNDMVDMVYKNLSEAKYISSEEISMPKQAVKAERISSLAQQSFEREKELSVKRDLRELKKTEQPKKETATVKTVGATKKEISTKVTKTVIESVIETTPAKKEASLREEVQITFKKNLTPREQAVFEHFLNNKNHIVYAKELAQVLELPRDYVYKYIKNLRAKMNESYLQNADNGGFVLEIK